MHSDQQPESADRRRFLELAALGVTSTLVEPAMAEIDTGSQKQAKSASGRLKIICLEEHMLDVALAKAVQPVIDERFAYMNRVGPWYMDVPDPREKRPLVLAPSEAAKLLVGASEDRIAVMDAHGIDMQVLSYSNFTQFAPVSEAAGLARAANDRLADIVKRHPTRFGAFGTLPWQDPDGAMRELDRVTGELGFTAIMLSGFPGHDVLVDDARYDALLARMAELRTPLYIHPGPPIPAVQRAYYSGFQQELTIRFSMPAWGWHNEAGLQVIRLILGGSFDRHKDLQVISGHWGEIVPFYLQRMDDVLPRGVTGLARTVSQTYRDHVWVTPSGMLNDPHFEFIRAVLGSDRIMHAVDYPYLTMTGSREWLENLAIPHAEKVAIAHGNAERLLRL